MSKDYITQFLVSDEARGRRAALMWCAFRYFGPRTQSAVTQHRLFTWSILQLCSRFEENHEEKLFRETRLQTLNEPIHVEHNKIEVVLVCKYVGQSLWAFFVEFYRMFHFFGKIQSGKKNESELLVLLTKNFRLGDCIGFYLWSGYIISILVVVHLRDDSSMQRVATAHSSRCLGCPWYKYTRTSSWRLSNVRSKYYTVRVTQHKWYCILVLKSI